MAEGVNRAPVSVVIPFYNGNQFIERALASIRSQTLLPTEVIIADDGSREPPIVSDAGDIRVHVVTHAHNRGTGAARNSGVDAATQPWVAFLDQDDEWLPAKLDAQWNAVLAAGAAAQRTVFYGRAWRVLDASRDEFITWPRSSVSARIDRSPRDALRQLAVHGNGIPFITVLAARDAWLGAGRFDERLRGGSDDYAALLRMAASGFAFRLTSPELPVARRHETGFNQSQPRRFLEDDVLLLGSMADEFPAVRPLLRRGVAASYYRAARALLEESPKESLSHAMQALRLQPFFPRAIVTAVAAAGPRALRTVVSSGWRSAQRHWYG